MKDNDNNRRRSIWDMNILDTTIYLVLFIVLMMPGIVYNVWYRFFYQQAAVPDQISLLTKDIGQVGFSAAALGFAIIVVRRGIMALIDWPSKDKYRAEGRVEGLTEGLAVGRSRGAPRAVRKRSRRGCAGTSGASKPKGGARGSTSRRPACSAFLRASA